VPQGNSGEASGTLLVTSPDIARPVLERVSECLFLLGVGFFVLCNRHWFNRAPGPAGWPISNTDSDGGSGVSKGYDADIFN
jgi:hypothetical protein